MGGRAQNVIDLLRSCMLSTIKIFSDVNKNWSYKNKGRIELSRTNEQMNKWT